MFLSLNKTISTVQKYSFLLENCEVVCKNVTKFNLSHFILKNNDSYQELCVLEFKARDRCMTL